MIHTVIETQYTRKNGTRKTRTYVLNGPEFQTIISFWHHLVETEVIEDYSIYKGEIS
jgi:hypothetical protein